MPARKFITAVDIDAQCTTGEFIDDNVINYAQDCIKAQYNVDGLQDVLWGQSNTFKSLGNCIQILYDGDLHWVTVKIVNERTVLLFDSLGRTPSKWLMKQIAQIAGFKPPNSIKIHTQSVQRQFQGSNDCGPLAIAFALSLAAGGSDPANVTYDSQIRRHLRDCLLSGVFSEFPHTPCRTSAERIQISTSYIHSPEDYANAKCKFY